MIFAFLRQTTDYFLKSISMFWILSALDICCYSLGIAVLLLIRVYHIPPTNEIVGKLLRLSHDHHITVAITMVLINNRQDPHVPPLHPGIYVRFSLGLGLARSYNNASR